MSASHHPSDDVLGRYAAGTLDGGQQLVVDVHASYCSHCRRLLGAMAHLGGEAIEAIMPATMSIDAYDAVIARALSSAQAADLRPGAVAVEGDDAMPAMLNRYPLGKRRRLAPGVSLRPITLPFTSASRVFLLSSAPGTKMLEHSHSGTEFTCVLRGSFKHKLGRYGVGDFDYGDAQVDHEPVVTEEGVCVCLVAMTGKLKPQGWFGRLIAPFIRI